MAKNIKMTKNGLPVSKKESYRQYRNEAQKKSRKRKMIAAAVAAVVVAVGALYYVYGGTAAHQSKSMATGQQYTMAIQRGSLYAFGSNNFGQLGDGTTEDNASAVKALDDVVVVADGYNTSYAITSDGTLYGWGANEYGQLGDGTTDHSSEPIKIMENVTDVAAGTGHVLAVTEDGSLYAWGCNDYNAVGEGYGDIKSDTEDPTDCQSTPVKIMDDAASVSAGNQTSYVVKTDGTLYGWGLDQVYQVGVEPDQEQEQQYYTAGYVSTPTKIMDNVQAVSAGRHLQAMALTNDGEVYAWGDNVSGAVGCAAEEQKEGTDYVSSPVKVLDGCVAIAAGNGHSMAIKKNGTLYAWGSNAYGQTGLSSVDNTDNDNNPYQSTPKKVRGGVAEVAANGMHTIIRTKHGSLITWGNNSVGQCGTGAFTDTATATHITITG